MSQFKFLTTVFTLLVIFSSEIIHHADGVPIGKTKLNATRNSVKPTARKAGGRNARFLGKFSLVAGLGLPDSATPPAVARVDDTLRPPVNYNFPSTRWGPYVAAVYEPVPIVSYFQNHLGYIAAALNPFNWFGEAFSTTTTPPATSAPEKHQDSDLLLLVNDSDNDVTSDDRNSIFDKMEMKVERDDYHAIKAFKVPKLTTKSHSIITTLGDLERNTDLLAEETTLKLSEQIEDSRQSGNANVGQSSDSTPKNMHSHSHNTVTEMMNFRPTEFLPTTTVMPNNSMAGNVTKMHEMSANSSVALNMTGQTPQAGTNGTVPSFIGYYYNGYPQNISYVDLTTSATATTANNLQYQYVNQNYQVPDSYGLPLPVYSNPIGGYYYGGNPQNVANIELTTEISVSNAHQHLYDQINQNVLQSANYDLDESRLHDNYHRYDNALPERNDYYSRNNGFAFTDINNFNLNGFKPSFPFYL